MSAGAVAARPARSPPPTGADSPPLFWTHVAPYGEVRLDMNSRLALGAWWTPCSASTQVKES